MDVRVGEGRRRAVGKSNKHRASKKKARQLLDELVRVSGEQNVVPKASPKFKDYSEDMAGYRAEPGVVVRPGSEAEVKKIVALASKMNIPVVPRGAGSSLTGASVLKGAIVIDMRRMDRVLKVDTVNWYVSAQTGITL